MDGEALVRHAEKWKTVPKQQICETRYHEAKAEIPKAKNKYVETSIFSLACNQDKAVDPNNGTGESIDRVAGEQGNAINYLEHVQAKITLKFRPRGSLKITLISPKGTKSDLLLPRIRDTVDDSFNNWPFLSVHFWNENPTGNWTLRITNANSDEENNGYLLNWALVFYGTYESPEYLKQNNSKSSRRQFADNIDKKSVDIERELESIRFQPGLASLKGGFAKSPNNNISSSVTVVIVLMCVALLAFMIIIIQMSYWPKNVFKNHKYRRLNTLDDEDKMFNDTADEMKIDTRNESKDNRGQKAIQLV